MLIVLPPSEGKTTPERGKPLDLETLSFPELGEMRRTVLSSLQEMSADDDAPKRLGVGASLAHLVRAHAHLESSPAAPAREVYTGVLFAAVRLGELSATGARRARRDVVIFSGLYGAVTPQDRIAAYRLPMGASLPGVGKIASAWRPHLARALDPRAAGDVVIDARSTDYRAAWNPSEAADHLTVDAVSVAGGKRSTISHNAKLFRGVLTRHLLQRQARPPRTTVGALEAARELIGHRVQQAKGSEVQVLDVELVPGSGSSPDSLTLVIGQ